MHRGRLVAVLVAFLLVVGGMWATILVNNWGPQLGLDLQGGLSIILEPAPGQDEPDDDVLEQTVTIIRQRIDAIGVAEPDIARQGNNILVQLPGVADIDQAREIIGRTAQLQFRQVLEIIPPEHPEYDELGPPCDEPLIGPPPEGEEVVLCQRSVVPDTDRELPRGQWTKFRMGPVELSGARVSNARAEVDPAGIRWQVSLDLDGEGSRQFAQTTGRLACEPLGSPLRQMAIVLDGLVESAPQMAEDVLCNQGITGGQAIITVGGAQDEARELALVLRTGALPIQLEEAQFQSVSPTLGEASLGAGLFAGFLGLLLVAGYMIVLYRGIGVAAVLELAMFGVLVYGLIIVLGNTMGFTLTLAGIAGIIVSIGIAADSSIIYRERYRDEIRAGRTVRTAAEHAFAKAWKTNLTGNTVSFLAAVVLYMLAIGPVRGFAFTLGMATLVDTVLFGTFTRSTFSLVAGNAKLARSKFMGLRAEAVAPDAVGAATKVGMRGGKQR